MVARRAVFLIALISIVALAVAACGPDAPATQPSNPSPQATAVVQQPTATTQTQGGTVKQWSSPPSMVIDATKDYRAVVTVRGKGEFVIDLAEKDAPKTVNNFVFLAQQGYYDGITFHRVIAGFMAQGGDPTGTGTGGPGYNFENEFSPNLRHDSAGIVSMANAGIRNGRGTNGSQFFITYGPTLYLDGLNPDGSPKNCAIPGTSCHAVFGKVISGMEVVQSLNVTGPGVAPDVIESIRIETQ